MTATRWRTVKLAKVMQPAVDPHTVDASRSYPNLGIYSFGRGVFSKLPIEGSATSASTLYRVRGGQFIYSRLFAFEGAYAVVPQDFDGCFVSNEFPAFDCDLKGVDPRFIGWLFKRPSIWRDIAAHSTGLGNRRQRIHPEQLLEQVISLPSLNEQKTIVARLEALAEKTLQVEAHLEAVERDAEHLLALQFRDAIANAPFRPMAEVAPLVRREISIDPNASYTELGVRSFYKGTFQRRTVTGAEFSWQDLYGINTGDLVFSNIMAWEQAIAIAKVEDDGCVGNHRMLTCEAKPDCAVPGFLWYYFTTPDGFDKVYTASPGTSARNRTMTAPSLMAIEVPLPPLTVQQTFDRLHAEVVALKDKHAAIRTANKALLPAILERVFS